MLSTLMLGLLQAITSRALLLAAAGRTVSHARASTLYLTPLHAEQGLLKRLIASIGAALRHVRTIAEQFKGIAPWTALLRYLSDRIAPVIGPGPRRQRERGNCGF